jgi:hypothetical protein
VFKVFTSQAQHIGDSSKPTTTVKIKDKFI